MAEEIVNKIKNSSLIQLDLADFKPKQEIIGLDLQEYLFEGLILKEKAFRAQISEINWDNFKDKVVAIYCSTDAILPTWAFMLITANLSAHGIESYIGNINEVQKELIRNKILNFQDYKDLSNGKFIIKGCSDISHPAYAMSLLTNHLIPNASSIMYGEPCSTVPIFKRKK